MGAMCMYTYVRGVDGVVHLSPANEDETTGGNFQPHTGLVYLRRILIVLAGSSIVTPGEFKSFSPAVSRGPSGGSRLNLPPAVPASTRWR